MKEESTGIAGALCGMVDHVEGTKKNQIVKLRMGAPDDIISVCCGWVVTVGDVVAVAPAGVAGDNAILLDEAQLGWSTSSGSPVVLQQFDLLPGDSVPDCKPEKKKKALALDKLGNEIEEEGLDNLYASKAKLTKEEKAAQKAEKAKAKAVANGTWKEPEEEEKETVQASKKEVKDASKRAKARRVGGEEVSTDDELDSVGLFQ